MPWALAKDETKQDRLATVLYNLVESIVTGASLLESFLPETAERIGSTAEHRHPFSDDMRPSAITRAAAR